MDTALFGVYEGIQMKESIKFMIVTIPGSIFSCLFAVMILVGCSQSPYEQQQIVMQAFTNQVLVASQIKATTLNGQYIVRLDDGSVWEIKNDINTGRICYRNCLFDPQFRIRVELPILEKE